jgi:hypothetical protein
MGTAKCSTCHVPPIFTEPGYNLHTADEIGIDSFQADRGPERRYVTTPLRALFDTQKIHKGGFYHDGRFATLDAVVTHYDNHLKLKLSAAQRRDLIEYLKSIERTDWCPTPRVLLGASQGCQPVASAMARFTADGRHLCPHSVSSSDHVPVWEESTLKSTRSKRFTMKSKVAF